MINGMVKPVSHKNYTHFVGIEYPNEWLFKSRRFNRTVAGCVKGGEFFVEKRLIEELNDGELLEIVQIASEFENESA